VIDSTGSFCLLEGSTASSQSVARRRHSSAVPEPPVAAMKTATRRKAASVDEPESPPPCKQPIVEISPLSDSKLSAASLTVVCQSLL